MELEARFRSSGRAFLRDPSALTLKTLLAHFALHYVARKGSEVDLDDEMKKVELNARNILAGLP